MKHSPDPWRSAELKVRDALLFLRLFAAPIFLRVFAFQLLLFLNLSLLREGGAAGGLGMGAGLVRRR